MPRDIRELTNDPEAYAAELSVELASPDAAFHIGPQHVVLETAAIDMAAELVGPGGEVVGVESDAAALETARTVPNVAAGASGGATLTIERFSTDLTAGAGHDGGLVTFEQSDREVQADGDTPLLDIGEDAGVLQPLGQTQRRLATERRHDTGATVARATSTRAPAA